MLTFYHCVNVKVGAYIIRFKLQVYCTRRVRHKLTKYAAIHNIHEQDTLLRDLET